MSTRGAIARVDGDGFLGRYHHWDSYPSGLGKTLWDLYREQFDCDLGRMLKVLIDEHPGGWSTINGADNCPLIANNEQEQGGDEDFDDIGDACDDGSSPVSERPAEAIEIPVEIEGPPVPVGGIAQLPGASGSAGRGYVTLAALAAAALLALAAGAWYTRRRWGR